MSNRIEANINKETINCLCTRISVTSAFLAKKISVSEDKIAKWLDVSSDQYPTLNQAKSLAKALKIPFAGLYMQKERLPIKQLPILRNLRRLPNAYQDDSSLNLAVVELIRYHDFLSAADSELDIVAPMLNIPNMSQTNDAIEYAKHIRKEFALELSHQLKMKSARQFYLYIRQQIESKGIFVHCFTGVDVDVARGVAIFDEHSPLIGINDNDRYPAKTFSIIHELVHILKKQSALCNEMISSFSSQDEEVFCNAVSGEVLVPTDSLTVLMPRNGNTNTDLKMIEILANKYSVSKEVVTRRLYDTKYITKDEYDTFTYEIRQRFEQEKQEQKLARQEGRAPKIAKVPSREAFDKTSPAICKALLIGYNDGYFTKQEVSGLLGIKEKHISKFMSEVEKW